MTVCALVTSRQERDTLAVPSDPAKAAALLNRIAKHNDRESFSELFNHFGPRLKSFMMRKGADEETAEDLVQETMLAVWNKASLYSPEKGTVSTWIFTIGRNLRIDRLRRQSSYHFVDIEDYDKPGDDASSDEKINRQQEDALVRQALTVLPEEQLKVVQMSFLDDLSQNEIAKRLDVPLGTVKSRMRLAYTKLRQTLEGEL